MKTFLTELGCEAMTVECGKMPSSLRRGCFVVSKVVVPYVIDHLSKQQILLHLYPAPSRSEEPQNENTESVVIKFGQFVLTSWSALRSWCQRHSESIQYGDLFSVSVL